MWPLSIRYVSIRLQLDVSSQGPDPLKSVFYHSWQKSVTQATPRRAEQVVIIPFLHGTKKDKGVSCGRLRCCKAQATGKPLWLSLLLGWVSGAASGDTQITHSPAAAQICVQFRSVRQLPPLHKQLEVFISPLVLRDYHLWSPTSLISNEWDCGKPGSITLGAIAPWQWQQDTVQRFSPAMVR